MSMFARIKGYFTKKKPKIVDIPTKIKENENAKIDKTKLLVDVTLDKLKNSTIQIVKLSAETKDMNELYKAIEEHTIAFHNYPSINLGNNSDYKGIIPAKHYGYFLNIGCFDCEDGKINNEQHEYTIIEKAICKKNVHVLKFLCKNLKFEFTRNIMLLALNVGDTNIISELVRIYLQNKETNIYKPIDDVITFSAKKQRFDIFRKVIDVDPEVLLNEPLIDFTIHFESRVREYTIDEPEFLTNGFGILKTKKITDRQYLDNPLCVAVNLDSTIMIQYICEHKCFKQNECTDRAFSRILIMNKLHLLKTISKYIFPISFKKNHDYITFIDYAKNAKCNKKIIAFIEDKIDEQKKYLYSTLKMNMGIINIIITYC